MITYCWGTLHYLLEYLYIVQLETSREADMKRDNVKKWLLLCMKHVFVPFIFIPSLLSHALAIDWPYFNNTYIIKTSIPS
jgi:hypothetical protein